MREILRWPVNLGSDEDTDFARLHGDGAKNKEASFYGRIWGMEREAIPCVWEIVKDYNRDPLLYPPPLPGTLPKQVYLFACGV